jgi:hypothetical protein
VNAQLSLFPMVAPEVELAAPVVLALEVHWSGVTRPGVHSGGVLEVGQSVEAFARARFRGRWRSLEVAVAGQVVAAIIPDADRPQRRTLWIEGGRS